MRRSRCIQRNPSATGNEAKIRIGRSVE